MSLVSPLRGGPFSPSRGQRPAGASRRSLVSHTARLLLWPITALPCRWSFLGWLSLSQYVIFNSIALGIVALHNLAFGDPLEVLLPAVWAISGVIPAVLTYSMRHKRAILSASIAFALSVCQCVIWIATVLIEVKTVATAPDATQTQQLADLLHKVFSEAPMRSATDGMPPSPFGWSPAFMVLLVVATAFSACLLAAYTIELYRSFLLHVKAKSFGIYIGPASSVIFHPPPETRAAPSVRSLSWRPTTSSTSGRGSTFEISPTFPVALPPQDSWASADCPVHTPNFGTTAVFPQSPSVEQQPLESVVTSDDLIRHVPTDNASLDVDLLADADGSRQTVSVTDHRTAQSLSPNISPAPEGEISDYLASIWRWQRENLTESSDLTTSSSSERQPSAPQREQPLLGSNRRSGFLQTPLGVVRRLSFLFALRDSHNTL